MAKYTKRQLEGLWASVNPGNGNPHLMAAIALAESSGDDEVVNNIGACGLWQIHPYQNGCRNPVMNARMAGEKLRTQGLGAWETYTNGSYRQFVGYTELIPGESKVPLIGPLGEFLQHEGEQFGKGAEQGEEEAFESLPLVGGAIHAAGGVATFGKVLSLLTSRDGWIRIGKVLVGLFLLLTGVLGMASMNTTTQPVAAVTKKVTKKTLVSAGLVF